MSAITAGILFFAIPLVLVLIIGVVFGTVQQFRKRNTLQPPHPGFIPLGPSSTQPYGSSQPDPGLIIGKNPSGGFSGKGPIINLNMLCRRTGEFQHSCGCNDCQELRRKVKGI